MKGIAMLPVLTAPQRIRFMAANLLGPPTLLPPVGLAGIASSARVRRQASHAAFAQPPYTTAASTVTYGMLPATSRRTAATAAMRGSVLLTGLAILGVFASPAW
ncbi:hypothetical protein Raf01_50090 [Rugosimonospora africana]|uniref:Uncharacterized protein n=1 Tax=Rugosimonospora africana TaxID=556532 RepID=A0A8J3QVK4_9ACTN|nr:hypothetical protein Raf01_50090 [Rugosimonospora africana]